MKVKIKFNPVKTKEQLYRRFDEFTKDSNEMDRVGKYLTRNIRADAVEGIGYDGMSFPSIAQSTINRRKVLAEVNRTSRFFSPSMSNMTFMGETVKAITYSIEGNKINLIAPGNHTPMHGVRVQQLQGSDAAFSEILRGLKDLGYLILGVSKKSETQIRELFTRFLRRRM